ncbi:hypothetical protein ACTHRK_04870 [Dietzia cercidiphylli]|uniref:hypothetical protein n=1 Tax=Dietzia cercidiphylli TaxID=498199 RepID=UPI003F7E334F
MSDANTTAGRALALRLAAGDDPTEVHQLIQDHLAAYGPDDGRLVLAVALETMTQFIVRPAVAQAGDPSAYRAQFRTAADRIAAGPIEKEK